MSDDLSTQRARVIEAWRNINAEGIAMIVGMQPGRLSPYHERSRLRSCRRVPRCGHGGFAVPATGIITG